MEVERSLEINLISARDLKKVERFSGMKVYAVVSLVEGTTKNNVQEVKTSVDTRGGENPEWNCPVVFRVNESLVEQKAPYVAFKLKRDSSVLDQVIGKVNLSVKGLLDVYDYNKINAAADHDKPILLYCQVETKSRKPQGELYFSYRVTGHPAVPPVGHRSFDFYDDPAAPRRPRQHSLYAVKLAAKLGVTVLGALIPFCLGDGDDEFSDDESGA